MNNQQAIDYIKSQFRNAGLPIPDEELAARIVKVATDAAVVTGQAKSFDDLIYYIIKLSKMPVESIV